MVGSQAPTVRTVPEYAWSHGGLAVEIASRCGLEMDEWQAATLTDACGCDAGGKFAAFEVGVNVPRQNGKGGILEARELLAVELGDRLVIHSAHEFATSMTAMNRMEEYLEEGGLIGTLRPRGGISRSHGDEGFKFRSGQRIWYRTRTKGGGRGFTGDLVVLDEAMILQEMFIASLLPTMSARSMEGNPQLWYTGSAVDQLSMEHGVVFARLRQRGLEGGDPSLAYFEWTGAPVQDEDGNPVTPDDLTVDDLADKERWAAANPSLGIRIAAGHVEKELRSVDPRTFAVERLGVGDWPALIGGVADGFSLEEWNELEDKDSSIPGDLCFTFDVRPDRQKAVIVATGFRSDGDLHVEVVEHRAGTSWVIPRLIELRDRHHPTLIARTSHGPVAALRTQLEESRLDVTLVDGGDFGEACGRMIDLVHDRKVHHRGDPGFQAAVKGARTRTVGEAVAWSRKLSSGDVSPLVAASIGAWLAEQPLLSVYADRGVLAV